MSGLDLSTLIDHYILFYGLLKEANKISLLLFWTELWSILSYTLFIIRIFIKRFESEEDIYPENEVENYPENETENYPENEAE
ncbi:33282_t:CDS:2, partial [Gigaspora margarita]